MFSTILLGFDRSAAARAALDHAATLAEQHAATLVVVTASPPPSALAAGVAAGAGYALPDTTGELAQAYREMLAEAVSLVPAAVDVRHVLVNGEPAWAIADQAQRCGADVIVIGSRGRGSVRSIVLGSVSHGVLRRAGVPVLVVPAPAAATDRTGRAADDARAPLHA